MYLLLGITSFCLIGLGALAGVIYSAKLIADGKPRKTIEDIRREQLTRRVSKEVAIKESRNDADSSKVISMSVWHRYL